MAPLVSGAASTSVEDVARSPEGEHRSGTQASMESVVHKKKDASDKVKEKLVRDALPKGLRGYSGWLTPSGSIDVFTENEVIEVKHYKK